LAVGVGLPYIFFSLATAQVALLHICVADAAASMVTYFVPKQWLQTLPHSKLKTWIGSAAFFVTAFLCTWIFFNWWQALIIAAVGMALESLPARDLDNITVPLGVAIFIAVMAWC